MENFVIKEKDLKLFEQKIKSNTDKNKQTIIYCSFTYITPNYSVLLSLQELFEFSKKHNFKVILVIWDMSVFANSYYRKMKKKVSDSEFINNKIKELYNISYSLGYKEENISIYKSSELWKRFISYPEEDIYQGFYSTLVQLRVEKYALNYKAAYFIQLPINLFFCNYFHLLFPEDVDSKIDLIFFEEQREELYTYARKIMYELGITNYESPAFIIMADVPYLNYKEYEPEWNMTFADIHEIISNLKPPKEEINKILDLLKIDKLDKSSLKKDDYIYLSKSIHIFLQKRKKEYDNFTGKTDDKILSINDKKDLIKIGGVLRSEIALDILIQSDGKKSISKISKNLHKSIPTISTYVKKLKDLNLVRIQEDGNLKRTFRGFKSNFELGL